MASERIDVFLGKPSISSISPITVGQFSTNSGGIPINFNVSYGYNHQAVQISLLKFNFTNGVWDLIIATRPTQDNISLLEYNTTYSTTLLNERDLIPDSKYAVRVRLVSVVSENQFGYGPWSEIQEFFYLSPSFLSAGAIVNFETGEFSEFSLEQTNADFFTKISPSFSMFLYHQNGQDLNNFNQILQYYYTITLPTGERLLTSDTQYFSPSSAIDGSFLPLEISLAEHASFLLKTSQNIPLTFQATGITVKGQKIVTPEYKFILDRSKISLPTISKPILNAFNSLSAESSFSQDLTGLAGGAIVLQGYFTQLNLKYSGAELLENFVVSAKDPLHSYYNIDGDKKLRAFDSFKNPLTADLADIFHIDNDTDLLIRVWIEKIPVVEEFDDLETLKESVPSIEIINLISQSQKETLKCEYSFRHEHFKVSSNRVLKSTAPQKIETFFNFFPFAFQTLKEILQSSDQYLYLALSYQHSTQLMHLTTQGVLCSDYRNEAF